VILSVGKKFGELSGRSYGLFEAYEMDDAEAALVIIGSSAGTAKETIRQLRKDNKKVGLVKIRVFRPFPMEELAEVMTGVKAVGVMDKAESFSACGGPLFAEVRSALYDLEDRPKAINYVYGLGGRDICVEDFAMIYDQLFEIAKTGNQGEIYRHFGQREQGGDR
jgi:pyruvate ferredoxin oxidoreductase alpha subunit